MFRGDVAALFARRVPRHFVTASCRWTGEEADAPPGAALASVPFSLGGGLEIAYDLAVWRTFRRVRPPETGA